MELQYLKRVSAVLFGQRLRILSLSLFVAIIIICAFRVIPEASVPLLDRISIPHKAHNPSPRDAAANETLGFDKLLVLSASPSWRTRGLEAASHLTGLSFTTPPQPQNPTEFVQAFKDIHGKDSDRRPDTGSAKAWIAHVDLLKYIIAADYESAFIVEDDVDWDVRLKDQMRLVSDNVRVYTNVSEDDTTPFGEAWDVLWLGHCGSVIHPNEIRPAAITYQDDTRCETAAYWGWAKRDLRKNVPEEHRIVQVAGPQTVCTFGYGVTKKSAPKLLDFLGAGGGEAYDVHLSHMCKIGKLRCIVVQPEIFHHYEPPASDGYHSLVDVGNGKGSEGDEGNFEFKKGVTGNIVKSARCEALFNETCMKPPSADN